MLSDGYLYQGYGRSIKLPRALLYLSACSEAVVLSVSKTKMSSRKLSPTEVLSQPLARPYGLVFP
jgi:hypothetical protein